MLKRLTIAFLLAGSPALAGAAPAGKAAASEVDVGALLGSVRRAVGYSSFRTGALSVREAGEEGSERSVLVGRGGEIRSGDEFGFDGRYRWRHDSRRGMAIPDSLRNHEKNAWPLWARSYAWLNPAAGFEVAAAPGGSDSGTIALRVTRRGGLVPATIFIDRATRLPVRLVVPYERGPFTARYSDFRTVGGLKVPHRIDTSYRGESVYRTVEVSFVREAKGRLNAPALPADHRFDNSLPARVEVRRGPDFGAGVPGHSFVEPLVDGAPAGWWHFDSGADGMMIDETIADRLGMPIIGRSRTVGADGKPREGTIRRGKSFQIGRLIIRDPIYFATDLSAATAPPGEKRGGLIGYDVFARAVIEYAKAGAEIAVCDPARYRSAARWQEMGFLDQTAAVETRLEGGRTGLFQIDTGFAGSVDFFKDFTERTRLLEGRATQEQRSQGAGGTFTMRVGRIAWIELGGRRFRGEEAGFRMNTVREGAAGVIGRGLMRELAPVFDYPHRRIAFLPASAEARQPVERRCR